MNVRLVRKRGGRLIYWIGIIIASLVGIWLLGSLLFYFGGFNLTRLLSRPSDSREAVENGETLFKEAKVVVAVGAHPDDIEYWASGTLARLVKEKKRVIVVIGVDTPSIKQIRRNEQLKAARIVGYEKVFFLGYPDRGLADQPKEEVAARIENIFRDYRADTLITFDVEFQNLIYRHPDHRAAGEDALIAAQRYKMPHIYLFHSSRPDTFTDISGFTDTKAKAMAAHRSQQERRRWWTYLFLFIRLGNQQASFVLRASQAEGEKVGLKYAESFRKAR